MQRPIEVVERRRFKEGSEPLQGGGDLIEAFVEIESLCRGPERRGAARGIERQHTAGGAHTDGHRRGRICLKVVHQSTAAALYRKYHKLRRYLMVLPDVLREKEKPSRGDQSIRSTPG